jgi:dolichol-phosphate mannosyltransferase
MTATAHSDRFGHDGVNEPNPDVSVVIPVRNEAANIAPLVVELEVALAAIGSFEVLYVDDGSTDATGTEIGRLQLMRPWLRLLQHTKTCGQANSVRTGVKAARAAMIVTLDGDGQNDPAFIPALLSRMRDGGPMCGLVAGQRVRRKDATFKRFQSHLANAVRAFVLGDRTRDTGCGLKCFPRAVYLDLPFFEGLHRFLPALVRRDGYEVALIDVIDRPRHSGVSNYGLFDRLWVGIADMIGVRWLNRRRIHLPESSEVRLNVDQPVA